MATSGQGLWFPLGAASGDPSVRDYRHAARIFRSNDYARAPKSKYLFYVSFFINPTASANGFSSPINPVGPNELSYLVKNVEMPKFEIDVQDLNQYNRKVLVQRQIKYNPITIKFHDDNMGTLRDFWQSYYTYYYNDGRYSDLQFQTDDKYLDRKLNRWGFDTANTAPYLLKIEVFSMYHGQAQKVTFENPIISAFSHDSHDFSEGQGLMEATMTLHYTGVRYGDDNGENVSTVDGIPGFGQAAPETYDTEFSNLTDGSGDQVDPQTGQLYNPADGIPSSGGSTNTANPNYAIQSYAYNNNPSATGFITDNQIAAIAQNAMIASVNAGFRFPTATISPAANQAYGSIPIPGTISHSDGQSVLNPAQANTLYVAGSWQYTLNQKGYTPPQISAAESYIKNATIPANTNLQQVAETYLQNPNSPKLANFGNPTFGQPANTPTNINFSNPISSTQPVYNSQNWEATLSAKGYTSSDVAKAQQFLSTLKLSSKADLANVAETYINNTKKIGISSGLSSTPVSSVRPVATPLDLAGPNFNPVAGTPPTTTGSYSKI